jgi:ecotin
MPAINEGTMMIRRMLNRYFTACLFAGMLSYLPSAAASAKSPLDAFPPAADGMVRFVITLAEKARGDEDRFKVELIAGKTLLTDNVNNYRLASNIEAQNLKGWGYTYYEVTGSGETMGTLMAPPEGTPQVERFISGNPLLVRYNSRLPIVVYAPNGYQVRYRIWRADKTFTQASEH